mgnify:CR=1 FL=1
MTLELAPTRLSAIALALFCVGGLAACSGAPSSTGGGLAPGLVTTNMRLSAGYTNFAETFSGWRNSPADADVLAQGDARRAGFAAVYEPNSAYGAHWVMLLAR